jgi:L-fuconolactonase
MGRSPKLKGLRPMLQDLPDDDWIAVASIGDALGRMAAHGLVLDALVKPRHLAPLLDRLQRHPSLVVVIDHAAKPSMDGDGFESWRESLAALAALPQVHCKLSGLLTEARAGASAADLRRHADVVLESFGPERVIWGSDWPVLTLAAGYGEWVSITEALLSALSATERALVMGENALRVYRLSAGAKT